MSTQTQKRVKRVCPEALQQRYKQHENLCMLTCYDYSMAKTLDAVERIDLLLVGDSLAMTMLGHADTLSVTMSEMLHHVKAVSRGTKRAMVVADMPFMSYHVSVETAVSNAARMIQEGGAQAVKLEGATELTLAVIKRLVGCGIPVMGHIGYTPQHINTWGAAKVQGKTTEAAEALLQQALALQAAGVFSMVVELVPHAVGTWLTGQLAVPTIGIGAGPGCSGQVLVIDDLLGRYPDFTPKFVRTYANWAQQAEKAAGDWCTAVVEGAFPSIETESF